MTDNEISLIEKEIIDSLITFSTSNEINEERLFRKEFHTKFFETLKRNCNENDGISSEVSIKYGLIHNSIHTKFNRETCEIGDFLFIVKFNGESDLSKSVLLQVKCCENRDDNTRQKSLYSNWPLVTISRPRNDLFLNYIYPQGLKIEKQKCQSIYFVYSKTNIKCDTQYFVNEIRENEIGSNIFEEYDKQYFSSFLLNILINNEGRTFVYSPDKYNLKHRKYYNWKQKINEILGNTSHGIQFRDDWDFLINSIINYSKDKQSAKVERQKTTLLSYIALTDNPNEIEESNNNENSFRIVEIEINKKKPLDSQS